MAKIEETKVTFVCDRCGFGLDLAALREDEARNCGPSRLEFSVLRGAVLEHDRLLLSDPTWPLFYLCPSCTSAFYSFLAGAPVESVTRP